VTFAGAPLSTLAPIFGVAAAAVTALYILKLRRRRVEVPFAKLWQKVIAERESSSLWRRLRRLLSLLLQLALLAILAIAAGDPRLTRGGDARTIALVIDASASMRAVDEAPDRLGRAKEEARKLIAGFRGGDQAVVVRLDGQPLALGGLENDDRELIRQVDSIVASDTPADLDRGLRMAADLLRGQSHPTLILIGDGAGYAPVLARAHRSTPTGKADLAAIDLSGIDLRYVPIGQSGDNLGIVGFAVRRYQANRASYEVFVQVRNFRETPQPAKLELLQDGETVDVQPLDLKPHETLERFYPNLAGAGTHLEARLSTSDGAAKLDAFALDDHAYALLPPRKKQKVLLVSDGNLFLEGALLLDENAAIDKLAPSAYDENSEKGYDAIVYDGFTPQKSPSVPALYLDPQGEQSPFPIRGTVAAPYVTDVAAKHPLMRWVTLRDLNMTKSSRFALAPGEVALASSAHDVIIAARETNPKAVALGFDVRKSDLPLRVAFPVLLVNALEWFAGDGAALQASYQTGHAWRIPVGGGSVLEEAIVTDPDGTGARAPIVDGTARYYGSKVGFYTIDRLHDRNSHSDGARSFAASLVDPDESAIAPARELVVDGAKLAAPEGFQVGVRRELWALFVLAALAVVLLEWWSYNRRVTV
jgi:hypothetical protein